MSVRIWLVNWEGSYRVVCWESLLPPPPPYSKIRFIVGGWGGVGRRGNEWWCVDQSSLRAILRQLDEPGAQKPSETQQLQETQKAGVLPSSCFTLRDPRTLGRPRCRCHLYLGAVSTEGDSRRCGADFHAFRRVCELMPSNVKRMPAPFILNNVVLPGHL